MAVSGQAAGTTSGFVDLSHLACGLLLTAGDSDESGEFPRAAGRRDEMVGSRAGGGHGSLALTTPSVVVAGPVRLADAVFAPAVPVWACSARVRPSLLSSGVSMHGLKDNSLSGIPTERKIHT